MSSERGESIDSEPANYIRQPRSDWIDRVREADAEAEGAFERMSNRAVNARHEDSEIMAGYALIAIAAELRAQRIARRPGAGR